MRKSRVKLFKSIAIGLSIFLVIYLGISAYGAKESMEIPRLPLVYTGDSLGVPYQDVSFYSHGDGVLLKGWFVPGENDEVIIILHGGFQNRIDDNVDTLGLTRGIVEKGYSVLTYDLRGRGESEGKGQALSNIKADIGGAVDFVASRGFTTDKTCILGFCSGAASACIYASQHNIGKLILDGCFIDVKTMVVRQANSVGVPTFLTYFFMPGTISFTWALYGYHMVNPIDVVSKIICPILFIHEENDEFITAEETQRLYEASTNPANEIWEVSSANHSQGFKIHPQEYLEKVAAFIPAG
ncbi:MAG: alpha/beta hydrolase [Dehalococcoidales bacterium]